MKRIEILAGVLLMLTFPLTASGQQAPDSAKERTVTMQLQSVPLRSALDSLFKVSGYQYSVEPNVSNVPISVVMKDIGFDAALRQLISLAAVTQPGVYVEKKSGVYTIKTRDASKPAPDSVLVKFSIKYQNAEDLLKQLERIGVTRDIESIVSLPRENALLVNGPQGEIVKLRETIALMDVPAQMLSVRVGVTGPGVGNRPFQLGSMTRTLNGKEVVIDEETTSGGEVARLRVQVRPLLQGDGVVLAESDWDLSIPVGGGTKGPIRLVKRLVTTARLQAGRSITVGEVALSPFGGTGTVRLWLRADLIQADERVTATTDAGEFISTVRVFSGKPYVSAFLLAHSLRGQLRREGGHFEIRAGAAKELENLPDGEQPSQPGPFRLLQGTRVVTSELQFGLSMANDSRLVLDTGGEPLVPLEDVARFLGGRVQYDSAVDNYRIVGGDRLSSLRFPASDAKKQ